MSRLKAALAAIGPGAIVASATIGAGETVLAVRAGAWAGYDLVWLILLAVATKSFITLYLLGRYSVVSGQSAIERLIHFPGPKGWMLWTIMVLEVMVAPFVFVVIAVPCGRLMADLLAGLAPSLSYKWLASLFVALAILVGIFQSYGALEKSQAVVCLILLAGTVVATLLVRPDLWQAIRGSLSVGRFPPYPDWVPAEIRDRSPLLEMASVFGYSGSLAINYLVYSNWVLLKGWQRPARPSAGELRRRLLPLKYDVAFNAVIVLTVTLAFMLAGAAILRPLHKIPAGFDLLTEQAAIFARISPLVLPLYYATILAALWGMLNALPDIYGRALHGFLINLLPALSRISMKTVMRVFGLAVLALCWYFIWSGTTPIIMVDLVALFSTNIGVGLVCVAALWLDAQLPKEERTSRVIWWAAVAAALIVNFMALLSAREVLVGYLG